MAKFIREILAKKNSVVLAPMEGVVDWSMRDVLTRLGGFDLCVTEFIRVIDRAVVDEVFYRICPELRTESKTRAGVPILVQLLGGQPPAMAESAIRAINLGAIGIDLNFGCPAKTVNRSDGGAALLKDPRRVYDNVRSVREAVPSIKTVSAKVRLGFSCKDKFLEIAKAAEEGGADWLTVHARTRDEGYRPPAHWEYIARIRESIKIPVIANGDIWNVSDYERCREVSGCNAVMLGRGVIRSPDLALQIKRHIPEPLGWGDHLKMLIEFTELSASNYKEQPWKVNLAVGRYKQWLKCFRGREEANELFERTKTITNFSVLMEELKLITRN